MGYVEREIVCISLVPFQIVLNLAFRNKHPNLKLGHDSEDCHIRADEKLFNLILSMLFILALVLKATSWTLAIILSMVVSTIASSQEENRLPEYHPRSRKILVQDKSSTSMESQATPKSKTEERRELPTQSVWAADYSKYSILLIQQLWGI